MNEARQRILVVDDHRDLAEPIVDALVEQGYVVDYAKNGAEAVRRLELFYDVVILDLMLPDMSGESILRFLRQQHPSPSPFVLVLSARTSTPDKLSLFRLGCDDYICKPFSLEELSERVRAVLRRNQATKPDATIGKDSAIELDTRAHSLTYREKSVLLTPKETAILEMFLRAPGEIVHRREILHSVWGLKEEPDTNFIGVHFSNLRRKLAKVGYEEPSKLSATADLSFICPMTLKTRFTLFFVVVIGALTSVYSFLVYRQVASRLHTQAQENLSTFLRHEIEHWHAGALYKVETKSPDLYLVIEKNGQDFSEALLLTAWKR